MRKINTDEIILTVNSSRGSDTDLSGYRNGGIFH